MARERTPLVEHIEADTTLWRIHRATNDPIFFGPPPGAAPEYRFDAPAGEYRIAYLGTTPEASFAEVFLRVAPVEIIAMDEIAARRITTIRAVRRLTVVELHGPGLARAGVTGMATTGADYDRSRRIALGLWDRSEKFDGIRYRARHDDGELSVALFDRAADSVDVVDTKRLADDSRWLASLPDRYGFEFTP